MTLLDQLHAKLQTLTGRTGTVPDLLYAFLRPQTAIHADTVPDLWAAVREAQGLPLGTPPWQFVLDVEAPHFLGSPTISGSGEVGTNLTLDDDGSPTGYPTPTVSYLWTVDGEPTTETGTSYTVQAEDVGLDVTCVVTASNIGGVASEESNALPAVAAA